MARHTQDATGGSDPQADKAAGRPESGSDELDELVGRLAEQGLGPVESAAYLEVIGMDVDPRVDALAASALVLARALDEPRVSATAKSLCAARLAEALDRLRELNPPKQEDSPLDEVRARRDARIAEAEGRVDAAGR